MSPSMQAPPVQVVIDGRLLQGASAPLVVQGAVVVPLSDLRALAQRAWYRAADRSVTLQRGDRQIVLFVGRHGAWINGRRGRIPVPPAFSRETLYVPLAICARSLGARVVYDGRTHTALVTLPALPVVRFTPPPTPFIVPTPFPSVVPGTPPPIPKATASASPERRLQPAATPLPQPRRTPLEVRPSWP